ncbi:Pxl1p [Sporobolomyces koalae]|uniref:Pxl1p n=1 Tax=Sporobolomyces koalae TaxID=500713 RepID=UPI003173F65B
MALPSPRASPPPPLAPISSALSHLTRHLTPSKPPSRVDLAVQKAHTWCTTLLTEAGLTTDTLPGFAQDLSKHLLDFVVDSPAWFSPVLESVTSSTHGPRAKTPEGEKVAALVHVVHELLCGLYERARDRDGDWWYSVGAALGHGLTSHLEKNGVGRRSPEDLAYRTFLCSKLAQDLVRTVVPDPRELPKSSADDLAGLGRNPVEMAMKYNSLEALGLMLSKNDANRKLVSSLISADALGAILYAAFDHHLSLLVFELSFRLLPTGRRSAARKVFLEKLFSDELFGKGPQNVAAKLRKKMDELDLAEWEDSCNAILGQIARTHIRRSQPFEAISIIYNSHQLLLPNSSTSQASSGTPSLESIVNEHFYEPQNLWISRHNLAASLPIDAGDGTGYETTERAVVPMDGIAKVFVEEMAQVKGDSPLGCLRLTILLAPTHPLLIATIAHHSAPIHVGSGSMTISETQVSEYEAAAQELPKYHELVVLVRKTDKNTQVVLRETLTDRARQYPSIRTEIVPANEAAAQTDKITTATSPLQAPNVNVRPISHLETRAATVAPAAQLQIAAMISDSGQAHSDRQEEQTRRVTFAATPELQSFKQKSSVVEESLSSYASTPRLPDQQRSEDEPVRHSQALSILAPASADSGQKPTPKPAEQRRNEVAELAMVMEDPLKGPQSARGSDNVEAIDQTEKRLEPVRRGDLSPAALAPERIRHPGSAKHHRSPSLARQEPNRASLRRDKSDLESSELSQVESTSSNEQASTKSQRRIRADDASVAKTRGVDDVLAMDDALGDSRELALPSKKVVTSYSGRRGSSLQKQHAKKEQQKQDQMDVESVEEAQMKTVASNEISDRRALKSPKGASIATEMTKIVVKKRKSALNDDEAFDESVSFQAGESSSEDLAHPDIIGTGPKRLVKTVAKSTSSTRSKAMNKRRKLSSADSDGETDYDEPRPTLEAKRMHQKATKKYKMRKSPAKHNGKTRKAGTRSEPVSRKVHRQSNRSAEPEVATEDDPAEQQRMKVKPLSAASAKKVVVSSARLSSSSDEGIEVSKVRSRLGKSGSPETKQRTRRESSRQERHARDSKGPGASARNTKRVARQESTPPPFDVLEFESKPRSRGLPSESETASTRPKMSFSELLKNKMEANIVSDAAMEQASETEQQDFGGYENDFFEQDPMEERQETSKSKDVSDDDGRSVEDQANPSPLSLSPVHDLASIDHILTNPALPIGVSPHITLDAAKSPVVLAEDTPVSSDQHDRSGKRAGVWLGDHRIASQRAGEEISTDGFEPVIADIPVTEGEKKETVVLQASGREGPSTRPKYQIDAVSCDDDEVSSDGDATLDDSGVYVDVSMDQTPAQKETPNRKLNHSSRPAQLMTRKNRERRWERREHYSDAQTRFEEPIVRFMNNVQHETHRLINTAHSLSIAASEPAAEQEHSVTSRIVATASAAQHKSDTFWRQLQAQIRRTERNLAGPSGMAR